jgi:hypothetical protein
VAEVLTSFENPEKAFTSPGIHTAMLLESYIV